MNKINKINGCYEHFSLHKMSTCWTVNISISRDSKNVYIYIYERCTMYIVHNDNFSWQLAIIILLIVDIGSLVQKNALLDNRMKVIFLKYWIFVFIESIPHWFTILIAVCLIDTPWTSFLRFAFFFVLIDVINMSFLLIYICLRWKSIRKKLSQPIKICWNRI